MILFSELVKSSGQGQPAELSSGDPDPNWSYWTAATKRQWHLALRCTLAACLSAHHHQDDLSQLQFLTDGSFCTNKLEDCPEKGCDIFPDILSYFVFIDWLCFHNSTFLSSWWDRLHIAPLQLSKEHGWRRTKRFSYSWAGKHILKRAQLLLHGFYQDLTSLYAHTVVAILLYFEYHLEIPSGSFLVLRVPMQQHQLDRFATQKAKVNNYEIIICKPNCQNSEI